MLGNKDNGEFLGLSPKASFFAGLIGGILVLCTLGFFVLLTTTLHGGNLFAAGKIGDSSLTAPLAVAPTTTTPTTTPTTNAPAGTPAPITSRDHIFGDKNAKVTLVEYSDFECPFCKQFEPSMEQLMTQYQGKVRWVYRHYPLSFHQNAEKEAEASECISELGGNDAFWKYVTTIFQRTTSNGTGFALTDLPGLAQEIGVNKAKFQTCLDSGKYASYVSSNEQDGVNAGVTGTPGTVIIGPTGKTQLIPGAVSYDELKADVDSMLQ